MEYAQMFKFYLEFSLLPSEKICMLLGLAHVWSEKNITIIKAGSNKCMNQRHSVSLGQSMNSSYFLKGIGSNIKCSIVACRSSTSDVLLSYSYLIKPASGKIASLCDLGGF